MKAIRILYDISVLGQSHFDPRARSGIFRVIEELARGLAYSQEIELRFCASTSNYFQCAEYLRSHPGLLKCAFEMSPMQRLILKIDSLVDRVTERLKDNVSSFARLYFVLWRKLFKISGRYSK